MDARPEERIWNELRLRLAEPKLQPGEILEDGITPMRSVVTEPMQRGRLFLAGDAAHIVPATGAKGMNLAQNDVRILADALTAWYRTGLHDRLDHYSESCLQRVWRAEHFSAWMTALLHRDPAGDPFEHKLRLSYSDMSRPQKQQRPPWRKTTSASIPPLRSTSVFGKVNSAPTGLDQARIFT